MSANQPTEASFLKDVAEHEMHVLMDNGVYLHIRFKRPGTGCFHFDLVTYPGYLVYSGDMGCYVFARTNDMFEFFRANRKHLRDGQTLPINPGYWSEKLQAVNGNRFEAGATELDEDRITEVINEYRAMWMRLCRETGISKDDRRELYKAVDGDVLYADEPSEILRKANEFSYRVGGRCFQFDDLWEHNFDRFTYHFVWCCYALAWGVKKYDEAKTGTGLQP